MAEIPWYHVGSRIQMSQMKKATGFSGKRKKDIYLPNKKEMGRRETFKAMQEGYRKVFQEGLVQKKNGNGRKLSRSR